MSLNASHTIKVYDPASIHAMYAACMWCGFLAHMSQAGF